MEKELGPFASAVDKAHEVYWNALNDLGPSLGGRSVTDLLSDNMSGTSTYLQKVAVAARILDRDSLQHLPLHIYVGERWGPMGSLKVTVDGMTLPTCYGRDGVMHSPDGFEWGYGGSGPAQLAYGILAHHFGRRGPEALCLYQDFKQEVIARFDQDRSWALTTREIAVTLARILEERKNQDDLIFNDPGWHFMRKKP